jgi:putative phosphoribosyl transferase
MLFQDRFDAGHLLAQRLDHFRKRPNLQVLALPRGGVPVAYEVAKALRAPLDVFLVRKLGLPRQPELAMGAVATGGVLVINKEVVDCLHSPDRVVEQVAQQELREIKRQEHRYRHGRPGPAIRQRTVILIDDGLATGSTMRAAVKALRKEEPAWLAVAVPVGAADTCEQLSREVDEVVCAARPDDFLSVGSWYADFSPTSDEEVESLLEEAAQWRPTPVGVQ